MATQSGNKTGYLSLSEFLVRLFMPLIIFFAVLFSFTVLNWALEVFIPIDSRRISMVLLIEYAISGILLWRTFKYDNWRTYVPFRVLFYSALIFGFYLWQQLHYGHVVLHFGYNGRETKIVDWGQHPRDALVYASVLFIIIPSLFFYTNTSFASMKRFKK